MDIRLPSRGHGIAVDPSHNIAAVYARRPGNYIWIVDLRSGRVTQKITAIESRHYYGHGVYTPDGRYMLSSENAYETGEGRVGVYDVTDNYKRIAELDSHGIGPHEIKLLNDGKTLVIANGGIRTHPDLPRIKANLQDMQPNLAYVDIDRDQLINKFEPPAHWHQLSIRHIDVSRDDTVAIAMQYEGRTDQRPPLIAIHRGNEPMQLLQAPEKQHRMMRNYCGSVAFSCDSSKFAVSSPRGGLVTYWSAEGNYLGMHEQLDACGVCCDDGIFWVTDGQGKLSKINQTYTTSHTSSTTDTRWDNHLIRL